MLVLALVAAAALPLVRVLQGHPFRIRYSVPLVVAVRGDHGTGIGLLPRRAAARRRLCIVGAALLQAAAARSHRRRSSPSRSATPQNMPARRRR